MNIERRITGLLYELGAEKVSINYRHEPGPERWTVEALAMIPGERYARSLLMGRSFTLKEALRDAHRNARLRVLANQETTDG